MHQITLQLPLAEAIDAVRIVGWSLVLIVLVLAGFFGVMRLRHWLKDDTRASSGIGFTLSDLRQLHREGKMTDEEYERARGKMVAGAKAIAAKLPDPLARNRRPKPNEEPGTGDPQ